MASKREVDLVQAAARLRIPWHTAHRLVLVGTLKGTKRRGRWKVDSESLRAYERALRVEGREVVHEEKGLE